MMFSKRLMNTSKDKGKPMENEVLTKRSYNQLEQILQRLFVRPLNNTPVSQKMLKANVVRRIDHLVVIQGEHQLWVCLKYPVYEVSEGCEIWVVFQVGSLREICPSVSYIPWRNHP
uniref:Uncharacterized protein n=1 Tax=Spongospora subterranea TaxID=70186 RepID=A0A0H5RCI3_9EUKA|eukprot:CRZ06219.1 hypothetical protein [Spongospora subterranea]